MKLKSSVSNLKEVMDILSSITNEAKLEFDVDGLKVRAIDSARIAMVDLFVPKESFISYETDEKVEVSVELDKIKSVLRLASQSDDLSLTISGSKMKFSLGNLTKTISTLDTFVNSPKLPTVDPKNYVVIRKADLDKGLRAATDVRDSIKFTIEDKRFEASSKSESEEVNLVIDNENLIEIRNQEKASSSYPLDYLSKIIRAISFAETLKIAFNNDYPLVMEFNFSNRDGVKVARFLLAPRIE
ncbi:MAG: DNA polymerase sliding clamp [Cuniculiplasma sp.]